MTIDTSMVQDVLENYKSAVYEKDVDKFLSIYDPNVHIYDCWGSFESNGISLLRENVVKWFGGLSDEGNLLKVDFNDVVIEENANIAFVYCAVTFSAFKEESGEELRQMTNRFTLGFKKTNESWHIIHQHSSLPINMETGKGMYNSR